MTIKNIGLGVLGVGAVLGILAFLGLGLQHAASKKVGSAGNASETYYNSQWLVGGNQIGPTGTLNANSQFGTCNLIGGSAGLIASTTANFDCAVTGIQKGDTIVADLGANAPLGPSLGFMLVKAVASSTNGYITFTIANLTGVSSSTLGTNLTNGIEYTTWR